MEVKMDYATWARDEHDEYVNFMEKFYESEGGSEFNEDRALERLLGTLEELQEKSRLQIS